MTEEVKASESEEVVDNPLFPEADKTSTKEDLADKANTEPKSPEAKEEPEEETIMDLVPDKEPARKVAEKVSSRNPQLQDDDYSVDEKSGKVTVHAEHLIKDKEAIEKDYGVFLKIFNSKKNKGKAEFLAKKVFGFEGDKTRSAGKLAHDAFKAFMEADSDEDAEAIAEEFFPDSLRFEDEAIDLQFSPKKEATGIVEKKEVKDTPLTKDGLERAIKIWKVDNDSDIAIDAIKKSTQFAKEFRALEGSGFDLEKRISYAMRLTDFGERSSPATDLGSGVHAAKKPVKKEEKTETGAYTAKTDLSKMKNPLLGY